MVHSVLPTLLLNVPSVARKTATEVEGVLGPPNQTIGSSGERAHPRLSYQSGRVEITFVGGLATRIVLHAPSDLPFHKRLLAKLGLPIRKPTCTEWGRSMRWTNIAGVNEVSFDAGPRGGVSSVTIRIAHSA